MTGRLDAETIVRARAVSVAGEIHRRGIRLRRVGLEVVGACPVCGDGGKGGRSNRFAVHLRKNVRLCRRCQRGGGVIDLVTHLAVSVSTTRSCGLPVGSIQLCCHRARRQGSCRLRPPMTGNGRR